jgi:hypothetical protein
MANPSRATAMADAEGAARKALPKALDEACKKPPS